MFSGSFSAGDHRAVTDSGQAAVHLKMNSQSMAVLEEAHTPGRGRVLRESLMGRILWATRKAVTTRIPSWNSVWMGRLCKPPSGWSRPCVSQLPAWLFLQRRTLVALTWPVQLLVPRGAQDDFSDGLSSDWLGLRLCMWIVRPQKAELIFREELQAKEINSVLYIVHRLFKGLLLKKIIIRRKSRIHIWLKLLDS